jgi:hypothetical protein
VTTRFRVLDAGLAVALRHWRAEVTGARVHGWGVKSVGAPVRTDRFGSAWLHVQGSIDSLTDRRLWDGERLAGRLGAVGVAKPALLDLHDWSLGQLRFRATLHELAPSPAASRGQYLERVPAFEESWWPGLRHSLDALAAVPTEREAVTEAFVARRLREAYGRTLDFRVRRWTTAHADLHWGNLTAPHLRILDWETWGRAPAGYDAAFLLAASSPFPDVQARVQATFADVLDTHDGRLAQALVCAELVRRIELYGDKPLLYDALKDMGAQAAHALAP